MQNPHERWMPPGERYQHLAKRARELDPRTVVGVGSSAEIARMEKVVDRLEKQAREKAAGDPIKRAATALADLWQRGHAARQKIVRFQEEELRTYRREFAILGAPAAFYEPPEEIPSSIPARKTVDEYEQRSVTFAVQVASLEQRARKISSYVADWERLSPDQQTRQMLFAMDKRMKYPSDFWEAGE